MTRKGGVTSGGQSTGFQKRGVHGGRGWKERHLGPERGGGKVRKRAKSKTGRAGLKGKGGRGPKKDADTKWEGGGVFLLRPAEHKRGRNPLIEEKTSRGGKRGAIQQKGERKHCFLTQTQKTPSKKPLKGPNKHSSPVEGKYPNWGEGK